MSLSEISLLRANFKKTKTKKHLLSIYYALSHKHWNTKTDFKSHLGHGGRRTTVVTVCNYNLAVRIVTEMFTENHGKEGRHPIKRGRSAALLILEGGIQGGVDSRPGGTQLGTWGDEAFFKNIFYGLFIERRGRES